MFEGKFPRISNLKKQDLPMLTMYLGAAQVSLSSEFQGGPQWLVCCT